MTTLPDRAHSALLVVDVQKDVMAGAHRRDDVIASIGRLIARARSAGAPVVWVQHSDEGLERGSEGSEYVSELVRVADEPLVHKLYGDSFEGTELERVLADRGVGRLVVTGAATDACIRSTIHGAFVRGYDVTLVGDAHTTEDLTQYGAPSPDQAIAHTNLYWSRQSAPGRRGATVDTADVTFAPADGD
jgi:nicotinamidase-related amidase